MFTTSAQVFSDAFKALDNDWHEATTARAAFLVTPAGFSLAEESAKDNVYMQMQSPVDQALTLEQHAALASALRADCPVITFPGSPETPDAVFPNNVFGVSQKRLIVGAMRHGVRQREAEREDIRTYFSQILGYDVLDLRAQKGVVAELTGCLVIDHQRGVGFCGLSERCNLAGAKAMHDAFGLRLTYAFDLAANEYHTNVVLASLAGRGVMLAADGFKDKACVDAIVSAYDGHALMLTRAQKQAYAANAITLSDKRVWMSKQAHDSLDKSQVLELQHMGFALGVVDLSEIEKAGGSLRCCVAEIF